MDVLREIFNERKTNEQLVHQQFKMTGTAQAKRLLRPGSWRASIDLADAYLNIPLAKKDQKFQRLEHRGCIFSMACRIQHVANNPKVMAMEPPNSTVKGNRSMVVSSCSDRDSATRGVPLAGQGTLNCSYGPRRKAMASHMQRFPRVIRSANLPPHAR